MKPLEGKIALVAGATRGAGRGIAVELGTAGATVICTGRSTRAQTSDLNRPETIEETAELVSHAGGIGIAIRCDHSQESEVHALFECIQLEYGRLDILVNDIWGGEKLVEWGKKFWELNLEQGFQLIQRSIFTHIITSKYAVPLMLKTGGLILEITDGDTDAYRGNFFYDFVKNSVIRLAKGMAAEFDGQSIADQSGKLAGKPATQITVAALTPGFLRSEEMLEHFGVTETNWRDGANKDPYFALSETPHFIGQAVAALAADPNRSRFAGRALSSWDLSDVYGFTDLDGSRPHWGRNYPALKARLEAENTP